MNAQHAVLIGNNESFPPFHVLKFDIILLYQVAEAEEKTGGGLLLIMQAAKERPSVGSGYFSLNNHVHLQCCSSIAWLCTHYLAANMSWFPVL